MLNYRIQIIIFFWPAAFGFAQTNSVVPSGNSDGTTFFLTDSVIKREISALSIKKVTRTSNSFDLPETLLALKLITCSDTLTTFQDANIISNNKLVNISVTSFQATQHILEYTGDKISTINGQHFYGTDGQLPKYKIRSVRVLYSEHRIVIIPDSAFNDLYEPGICTEIFIKNERLETTGNNYRVFQSKDGKRMYIYMLNGKGNSRYEVTWVIRSGKYIGRRIELVPE